MQSSPTKSEPRHSGSTNVLSVLSLLESLVLAFVLACILKGFIVEAFVIPTGSMAESLLGMHTETICQNCRYQYVTGIPTDQDTNRPLPYLGNKPLVCPNCGDISARLSDKSVMLKAGDRVLVLKPMYFLSRYKPFSWLAPETWDVVVFLYPGTGQDNYIKRLTGLPGEAIEIIDGDIYIDGRIARKPPKVQEQLWIPLFDNDHQRRRQLEDWPLWLYTDRLVAQFQKGQRVLSLKASGTRKTLTYQGPLDNSLAYNALRPSANGRNKVSDLRLSFDLIPKDLGLASQVAAVLSKHGQYFRLRLDLSEPRPEVALQSGYVAELERGGAILWRTVEDEAGVPLRRQLPPTAVGKGLHLSLQNVDYRVSVWIDGREILATTDSTYYPSRPSRPQVSAGTNGMPAPAPRPYVAVTAEDCEVDLLHLKLDRDIYYTSPLAISVPRRDQIQDPIAAKLNGTPARGVGVEFRIPPRRGNPNPAYFMLGDNSSDSQDSRLWWGQHPALDETYVRGTVPRSHMIGQAFFVYWPAPGPVIGRQLPLIPRVGKMRLIR